MISRATPVKRVRYKVENTRVGQQTDYDKLTLEVWTNGAVSPQDAIGYAKERKSQKYRRKMKEVILAVRLERELTKAEILSIYLNHVYLGHGAYGVGAAAETYFGKEVEDLTIGEAAMLAGLVASPTKYAPHRNLELDGRDVKLTLPVAPWEAALGTTLTVPTLGGPVDLRIPAQSQSGSRLRLRGRGLAGDPPGDQYVVLKVVLPPADTPAAVPADAAGAANTSPPACTLPRAFATRPC